ncbi:MFS general substrate transporter [Lophiostoma macrostomum CBS 122681]|uniref:MFS general substrate transporter n=1 Tax=Lophiostoma macrostomum CBS 122681 TaxID=1314788 RepID=A0A6A6TAU3_9PLEO|nr:MFS general substrate transporter [Lophiostoma macrostomum CBS 122681]
MAKPAWLLSLTQHGSKPPYLLTYRSSDGFIIGTVALAVFTDMFLYGVIVPVIPFALQQRSHVAPDRVQYWVSVLIAIYGAALLAFSPVCGWLADHTASRRSPLLIGLLELLGSTVLLNVGYNISVIIVARILQGISAAVVWVVGLALLAGTVPQERLAEAMGYVSLGMSLGTLVAPLLGGVVFDRAGYDAVFGMAYTLVGFDIILRLLLVEKKVAVRWEPNAIAPSRTPTEDANTSMGGMKQFIESSLEQLDKEKSSLAPTPTDVEEGGLINDQDTASTSYQPPTTTMIPPSRLRDRLPPLLSLLYSRRLLSALLGSIVQAALLTSFDSVLTIRVAAVFHFSSTGAALLFLPIILPSFLGPLWGKLSDRMGGRYPASLGFLLATAPLVCLRFVNENTLKDKVTLCALLALIGLMLSMTFPPIMAEISGVVADKEKKMVETGRTEGYGKGGAYAQAYALFNVAFAAGCMVGPLLAGFVAEKSWGTMSWVLGLLSGITSFPTFLGLGGWVFGKRD